MTMTGRWGGKHGLSFEEYHSVPGEWEPLAVIAAHRDLGGTFDIASTPRQAVGSSGKSDYRALWYNVADGIRAGDAACIEIAIRFVEARIIVSYSGFARTRIARALKGVPLSEPQRRRLSSHFLKLLEAGDKCDEFREYLKLWPMVINADDRRKALGVALKLEASQSRFRKKLEDALSSNQSLQSGPAARGRPLS